MTLCSEGCRYRAAYNPHAEGQKPDFGQEPLFLDDIQEWLNEKTHELGIPAIDPDSLICWCL